MPLGTPPMGSPRTSPGKVFIADDTPATLTLFNRVLSSKGFVVCGAADGATALAAIPHERPDVVLLDVMMPIVDGFEVCRRLKSDPDTRLLPVVLVTGLQDRDSRLAGIDAGADDFLTKPVDVHELLARVRSLIRIKRYTDALDSAEAVIRSLALTIEARDPYTVGHCERLAGYAVALGERVGLDHEDLRALDHGGYLHDLGKIAIPDALLLKSGPLTAAEFEIMKSHTLVGDALCGELHSLQRVRPIILHHHERYDGRGYPLGLRGEEIPLVAQIMGIVDVYDALTTARPYKPAWPSDRAGEELQREMRAGSMRGDLVRTFLDLGGPRLVEIARAAQARPGCALATRLRPATSLAVPPEHVPPVSAVRRGRPKALPHHDLADLTACLADGIDSAIRQRQPEGPDVETTSSSDRHRLPDVQRERVRPGRRTREAASASPAVRVGPA
jgi:putative two-component system response regulator